MSARKSLSQEQSEVHWLKLERRTALELLNLTSACQRGRPICLHGGVSVFLCLRRCKPDRCFDQASLMLSQRYGSVKRSA